MLHLQIIDSPVGALTLATRSDRLCLVHFGADRPAAETMLRRWYHDASITEPSGPMPVAERLACYFAGGLVGTAILGEVFDRIGWPACVGGIALALGAAALLAFRLVDR